MTPKRSQPNELILGLVSISDRASRGIYEDKGIPALKSWCEKVIASPVSFRTRLIADDRFEIEQTLRDLVDREGCDLVLTTGGTGPARRDVTPEATLAVATREMPGFAEQMRRISLHFVPTAILSRQVAVLREIPDHSALIVNLPGQPKAIAETLGGVTGEGKNPELVGIFAAIPYCIDLIGGPYIETRSDVMECFRPKSARKPSTGETPSSPLKRAKAPASISTPACAPVQKPVPARTVLRDEGPIDPAKPTILRQTPSITETDVRIPIPTLSLDANEETPVLPSESPSLGAPNAALTGFSAADLSPSRWDPPLRKPACDKQSDRPHMTAAAIARRSVQRDSLPPEGLQPKLEPLPVLIRDPSDGSQPSAALIMLHGMGVTASDFESFNEELQSFGGPAIKLFLPQAPRIAITASGGYLTQAWYDLLSDDFNSHEDVAGILNMVTRISQLIGRVMNEGFAPNRIFLGGFSQGAAMALCAGLRQPITLGGILCLSGYLPLEKRLTVEITPQARQTPVFIGHGAFDDKIELPIAQKCAQAVEKLVDTMIWREYNMAHEICPQEGADIAKFINTALDAQ